MITDQGRWDDRDYYDEHFYDSCMTRLRKE